MKVQGGALARRARWCCTARPSPRRWRTSLKLVEEKGYTFVHPYDDPEVIAGQGTVAMEILRQQPGRLDAIFVPVGGGGLIAGIAAYVKYLRPDIKVIGVEPEESDCLRAAMAAGERVVLQPGRAVRRRRGGGADRPETFRHLQATTSTR